MDTGRLRSRVHERAAQVQVGAGEDELAAALGAVLDLLDDAGRRGATNLDAAEVCRAIRDGLA